MKIRMLESRTGRIGDDYWSPRAGDVLTVSAAAGAALCSKGVAEPVAEDRTEKAVPKKRAEKRG